jgi:hypothetical protein
VGNNPILHNDPTGHCFDGITTAICIGAIIGAGVDLYTQYQEKGSLDEVNWKEVAVAGAVGAVGGLVAAAVIVPVAAAAGTAATAATGAAIAGSTVELTLGGFMAGSANVMLANAQRVATHAVRGETVTQNSIMNEFDKNYSRDMSYGAASFGIGKALSAFGSNFFTPSSSSINNPTVFGAPDLSKPLANASSLLNINPIQKAVIGAAQAGAAAASNSTLLQCGRRDRICDD